MGAGGASLQRAGNELERYRDGIAEGRSGGLRRSVRRSGRAVGGTPHPNPLPFARGEGTGFGEPKTPLLTKEGLGEVHSRRLEDRDGNEQSRANRARPGVSEQGAAPLCRAG